MIPFFLRHYEPLVERMFVYDNGSTDRSRELLQESDKVELRHFDRGDSFNLTHLAIMNQCWKESRGKADWVIIADIDEFLYHPQLRDYLTYCRRNHFTVVQPLGMEMISADFPHPADDLTRAIRRGLASHWMDKLAIFDPDAIDEINYHPGRHTAAPQGLIIYPPERAVRLLHYKNLGAEYLVARTAELRERKTDVDRARNFSIHLDHPVEQLRAHFAAMLAAAEEVI